jgi:predicted CoA-binding protein
MKTTVVIGASPNAERFSFKAVKMLRFYGHNTFALGIRKGEINGLQILTNWNITEEIDTVTMYIGAKNQPEHYNFILGLKPKRIIFNPGTENRELAELARKENIQVVENCTLVMLSQGIY